MVYKCWNFAAPSHKFSPQPSPSKRMPHMSFRVTSCWKFPRNNNTPVIMLSVITHGDRVLLFSFAGCLLDFLKTDEGKKLKLNKLIDMSAQVGNFESLSQCFRHDLCEGSWLVCDIFIWTPLSKIMKALSLNINQKQMTVFVTSVMLVTLNINSNTTLTFNPMNCASLWQKWKQSFYLTSKSIYTHKLLYSEALSVCCSMSFDTSHDVSTHGNCQQ